MSNLFKFREKVFVLIALLLVSISSVFAEENTIAIINAGSSGSRFYVYEVDKDNKDNIVVTCLHQKGENIILSDFVNEKAEDKVKKYIGQMIGDYSPKAKIIKLYLLATAGMRNENVKDSAENFYKKASGMKFNNYEVDTAMTISGRYEGLYAWIAANYEELKDKDKWEEACTKGILEIGGQSMQITYILDSPIDFTKISKTDTIKHSKCNLYSKSYVNGGVNAVSNAIKGSPCLIRDYEKCAPDLNKINIPANPKFFGLGGTINGINNTNSFVGKLNMAIGGDQKSDNARYLKWVLGELKLLDNDKIEPKDVDWTLGAAYDIVINNKGDAKSIEKFDYENPN